MPKEIDRLVQGYQAFRSHYFNGDNLTFEKLVYHGQHPKALMIACSDSRVDPAIIMNVEPGDLFIIRNVANLVPPYEDDDTYHGTSAALEFGVCILNIRHIIIFGHTQCGGIRALLDQKVNKPKSFIGKWMELAKPAYTLTIETHPTKPIEEQAILCGQYALINSLQNLLTYPWIYEKSQKDELFLHAWYFDLSTGFIHAYDPKQGCFCKI